MKQSSNWIWILALIFISFLLFQTSQEVSKTPVAEVSYSQFKELISNGSIKEIKLKGNTASAELTAPIKFENYTAETNLVTTILPIGIDPDVLRIMDDRDIVVWNESIEEPSWFISFLPWIVILAVYFFLMRRMFTNPLDRFGGKNAGDFLSGTATKDGKTDRPKVTFKDVAGQDAAKREVAELVDFLKYPENYEKLGAETPRGILLVGPPGTGKTLLARALAGEAGVSFFDISASEFIEMFVGVGASRVRKMFDEAKKRAPSIIFIDELDAVGRVRGTGLGGGNDEREQTLNQILSEMDGFSGHETVIVLAATNRPDVLDPALLRPGRFDRHVTLELPDKPARVEILKVHLRKVPLATNVDIDTVAASCPGFSGADLKNLVNEAAIAAARDGATEVTMNHFDQMRDKIIMGTTRTLAIHPDEHRRLAVHEAGHTAVSHFLPNADPLYKVTIIPRGRALGSTHMLPTEERHTFSEDYLRDRLAISLAGRCAEKIFLGNVSSGADDDIKNATQLARSMVSRWGMSEKIGPVDFRQSEEHPFLGREIAQPRRFSESMSGQIDQEVTKMLLSAEERAREIIVSYKNKIEQLIETLEAEETINLKGIEEILGEKIKSEHSQSVLKSGKPAIVKNISEQ
tara:strand:+ start:4967 stop:6868 length:1902 start_codon:yes stop_codon:yes gene_type:complete